MAGARSEYTKRLVARARELRDSDAFAAPEPEGASSLFAEARAGRARGRRQTRAIVALFVLILVAVVCMSLCLPYYGVNAMGLSGQVYDPAEVFDCYRLWFDVTVMPIFDPTMSNRAGAMLAEFSETHDVVYQLVIQRGAVTLVVIACGFLLAVSGLLFQTAFRNPLATPTMLGVADGVTIGCIVFAFAGFTQASDNMPLYLALVYGFGALAVVAVLLLSRAIGGTKHYNVFDMLLLGTVICQLLGGASGYVTNFIMDTTTWQRFYELQQAGNVLNYPQTWIVVGVVFVVCAIPTLVLRFKFNLIAFPDDEARLMGVRPGTLRAGALVLGSVMQLAAIASVGPVAMLSLAVPFVVRYLMPSEFRFQLLGNVLLGVLVLLACIDAQHFATIGFVTVPVGTIISVLIIPFFAWAVALQSNRWGD